MQPSQHPEPEKSVPKTFSQMKKRLEEVMTEASEAEEVIPLLKEAIAKFELVPADLFELTAGKTKMAQQKESQSGKGSGNGAPMYRDAEGNTWAGRGRRPAWVNEALAQGKTLEDFRARGRESAQR